MPDYRHDLQFGVFITPVAGQAPAVLELSRLADVVGLDIVSFQDHPYQASFLDTWTLLSVVAAETTNLRVAPNVANLPLRPPVVLARSAASLDILSDGRVELGLGAGAFWDAIAANGGPRLTPGQGVDALAEAVDIIRAIWSADGPVRHHGRYYQVDGAQPGPPPAHDIEIWLGAYKPRMLRLTGAKADGWIPSQAYVELERLPAMNAAIDDAAASAGRRPEEIRRLFNVNGSFGAGSGFLQGTPQQWAEQLTQMTLSAGMSTYILAVSSADDLRRFAEEVAPATREQVAGRQVIDVHDALRAELDQLRDLVEQVAAGTTNPAAVRTFINRMTIRQNHWTLGTFCVFPHLRHSEAGLGPVIDRLEEEHEKIADLLERVDRALVALVSEEEDGIDGVARAMDLMTDALLSHFSYEERELVEPLARHGFY